MTKMSDLVETIGYNGPQPLAIIFWYKKGDDSASYKTVCYNEQEVACMYERYTSPGDIYNTLRPSIQLVGQPLKEVKM